MALFQLYMACKSLLEWFTCHVELIKNAYTYQTNRCLLRYAEGSIYCVWLATGTESTFFKAYSLVSSDKPNNKDAHMNWQVYSSVKRELFVLNVILTEGCCLESVYNIEFSVHTVYEF